MESGVGPRQTAPEWPDKLLVPVAPPSELPLPLPATRLGLRPPVAPACARLPSSHRAPGGRDGAGCSRLPAPAASKRGRPSGSRPGRRSPRRVPGSRPRRAVQSPGGQPLGRLRPAGSSGPAAAGRGGAGPGAGGRAAQGQGAEAARCAREAAGSGTETGQLHGAGAPERGRQAGGGAALAHGAPLGPAPGPGPAPPLCAPVCGLSATQPAVSSEPAEVAVSPGFSAGGC